MKDIGKNLLFLITLCVVSCQKKEDELMGYPNEQSVIKAWMQSRGHCTNIMNKNLTEVGVGREANYWTMALARPR